MDEKLSPERAVRLLRAKAAELENMAKGLLTARGSQNLEGNLAADIALVAGLLADHIEDMISDGDLPPDATDQRPHSRACGPALHPHGPACHPNCPTCHGLTTVEVQHDATFNERVARDRKAEMHLRHLERDPRQPFDGS